MSGASAISLTAMQSKPAGEKWMFTEDQLQNTPSRRENVLPAKELNYRQQAANLIQDMGQRLPVNQLTINTAIVYMHRFYMFHSFPSFSRFVIAPTALFLAAKVEEQPRKLEHVLRVCHSCLYPDKPQLDVHSDYYMKQAQQLVEHELIMLQTLGFDISIDHPHTHVVKCTQLVKASRDLSQMAYFMATNSLHLTTFCLKYKPTVVSAMCIHLSCKWSNYEIPLSSEGKAYWTYMDSTITEAMLENIISEFLKILDLCPTRLRKLKNYRPSTRDGSGGSTPHPKDSGQKPSTSKATTGNIVPHRSTDGRRPAETGSIEQKKASTSLTIAEYKHKREKELQQQQSSGKLPSRPEAAKTGLNATKVIQPSPMAATTKPSITSTGVPPQVKTEGHPPVKHPEKIHSNPDHRKRQERSIAGGRVNNVAGIPGLQRPKHPSIQPSHRPAQNDKDHSRLQAKHGPHHDVKHAIKSHDKVPMPKLKENHLVDSSKQSTSHEGKTGDSEDNILAGMERKVMEQMHAVKTKEVPKLAGVTALGKAENPGPLTIVKEQKAAQNITQDANKVHAAVAELPKSYKDLYEMYKRHPDTLGHQLKHKAQTTGLSDEEKIIWHKLRKSEDRKRRKKHEKQRSGKTHSSQSNNDGEQSLPSSGSLTVRIKLPSSTRNEALKSSSSDGNQQPSTSASDTTKLPSPGAAAMKAGKKRPHSNDLTTLSASAPAKHSRKSEGHHHESHDQARHRHKHSRSSSHHHHSKHQAGNKIDEATFQQALNDAVNMVQTGQTVLTDRVVPTVTLKRAETQNGKKDGYVAHSSKQEKSRSFGRGAQHGFDPSAPVSATPPENLFGAEAATQSKVNHTAKDREQSSPEMGEILDDDDDDDALPHGMTDYNSNVYRTGPPNNRLHAYTRPDKVADKTLSNSVPANFKRSDHQRT